LHNICLEDPETLSKLLISSCHVAAVCSIYYLQGIAYTYKADSYVAYTGTYLPS